MKLICYCFCSIAHSKRCYGTFWNVDALTIGQGIHILGCAMTIGHLANGQGICQACLQWNTHPVTRRVLALGHMPLPCREAALVAS